VFLLVRVRLVFDCRFYDPRFARAIEREHKCARCANLIH